MSLLYVIGGKQRERTLGSKEWSQYGSAVALAIDPVSGQEVSKLDYYSPASNRPVVTSPSVLFKSGHFDRTHAHLCTQTEIMQVSLPDLKIESITSLPIFNDLHHVLPTKDGKRLVAVTGLDMVAEIDEDGQLSREWSTTEEPTWTRFSKSTDYRKVVTTKPHKSHPNYLFELDQRHWVTRFEQRDAICLEEPDKRIAIDIERPHDGQVLDDRVYFTTVDGRVVVASAEDHRVLETYDLFNWIDKGMLAGWCRGLHVLDDQFLLAGFSRIRPTRLHANILWMKKRLSQSPSLKQMHTQITLFDRKKQKSCWYLNLENYGLDVIFTVFVDSDVAPVEQWYGFNGM